MGQSPNPGQAASYVLVISEDCHTATLSEVILAILRNSGTLMHVSYTPSKMVVAAYDHNPHANLYGSIFAAMLPKMRYRVIFGDATPEQLGGLVDEALNKPITTSIVNLNQNDGNHC